jgi:two-component system, chemotaxis family, chemotaxis protein CheY
MLVQPGWTSARDGQGDEPSGTPVILVVDDDPVTLRIIADTLADEGYEALTAPHGAAALDCLEQRQAAGAPAADLILLDMRMPLMDGWAFAEAYRRTPGPHAPIVVMTAAHDALDRAAQIGAEGVLSKPFDLDDLLAIVQRGLGHPDSVD